MFRLFKHYGKVVSSEKLFRQVIELKKLGNKDEALKLCTKLVEQNPKEVFYRHQLAVLQDEMGLPVKLPSISNTGQIT